MSNGSAIKMLSKELHKLGATSQRQRHGTVFTFPDGANRFVESNIRFAAATALLGTLRETYRTRPVLSGREAHTPPVINDRDLTVTQHAAERIRLMRSQPARMRPEEVVQALMRPDSVRWHDGHQSWMWVGERVAVAASVTDGHTQIRTVMWSTEVLWAENPRPETVR